MCDAFEGNKNISIVSQTFEAFGLLKNRRFEVHLLVVKSLTSCSFHVVSLLWNSQNIRFVHFATNLHWIFRRSSHLSRRLSFAISVSTFEIVTFSVHENRLRFELWDQLLDQPIALSLQNICHVQIRSSCWSENECKVQFRKWISFLKLFWVSKLNLLFELSRNKMKRLGSAFVGRVWHLLQVLQLDRPYLNGLCFNPNRLIHFTAHKV